MKRKRFLKERITSALTEHVAPQQPAMWDFIGAQSEKSAGKSAFIAASRFGDGAKDMAEKVPQNITTIDGEGLVECMVRHEIGACIHQTVKPFTK